MWWRLLFEHRIVTLSIIFQVVLIKHTTVKLWHYSGKDGILQVTSQVETGQNEHSKICTNLPNTFTLRDQQNTKLSAQNTFSVPDLCILARTLWRQFSCVFFHAHSTSSLCGVIKAGRARKIRPRHAHDLCHFSTLFPCWFDVFSVLDGEKCRKKGGDGHFCGWCTRVQPACRAVAALAINK